MSSPNRRSPETSDNESGYAPGFDELRKGRDTDSEVGFSDDWPPMPQQLQAGIEYPLAKVHSLLISEKFVNTMISTGAKDGADCRGNDSHHRIH